VRVIHNWRSDWKTLLWAGVILLFIALCWLPSFITLSRPTADQIYHNFGLEALCRPGLHDIGWAAGVSSSPFAGLFSPGVLAFLHQRAACWLSVFLPVNGLQGYLVLGLLLTFVCSYVACRLIGLAPFTSSLASALMVTAPCALSRIGHIDQVPLAPVLPTFAACIVFSRLLQRRAPTGICILLGLLLGLLSFPSQEYYAFFSLLILFCFAALQLIIRSTLRLELDGLALTLAKPILFVIAYFAVFALLFLPRVVAGLFSELPASWITPRYPIEQYLYGLQPMMLLIPPQLIDVVINQLRSNGIAASTEAFGWSMGSLWIPLASLLSARRLAQGPQAPQDDLRGALLSPNALTSRDLRVLALLVLLTLLLALLWMTSGGVGTLIAVYVSPVLRSLNRFTVYVYGISVLYLVSELDVWLTSQRHPARSAQGVQW
jgi:hypothetical protein